MRPYYVSTYWGGSPRSRGPKFRRNLKDDGVTHRHIAHLQASAGQYIYLVALLLGGVSRRGPLTKTRPTGVARSVREITNRTWCKLAQDSGGPRCSFCVYRVNPSINLRCYIPNVFYLGMCRLTNPPPIGSHASEREVPNFACATSAQEF